MTKENNSNAPRSGAVSMTGFGSAETKKKSVGGQLRISVEIKSVNSRYLDPSFKLPRGYGSFESDLRELLQGKIARGRVELVMSRTVDGAGAARAATFHEPLFQEYLAIYERTLGKGKKGAAKKLKEAERRAVVREILARSDVLSSDDGTGIDPAAEWETVAAVTRSAIAALVAAREREGRTLTRDIETRLATIGAAAQQIASLAARQSEAVAEKLKLRVQKIAGDVAIDPARLAAEVAILADRSDITEELVRLASHRDSFAAMLQQPQTGRRLDFLVQEIGRELNTIGSKAQVAEIQQLVVGAKAELEKIREQVQNIE